MKRNINHIDAVFNEKLKDFSQQPPPEVWQNIENKINKKKSPFVFYKIAAAVAAIMLVGSAYLYFTNHAIPENKEIAVLEKEKKEITTETNSKKENIPVVSTQKQEKEKSAEKQITKKQHKKNNKEEINSQKEENKHLQNKNNNLIALNSTREKTSNKPEQYLVKENSEAKLSKINKSITVQEYVKEITYKHLNNTLRKDEIVVNKYTGSNDLLAYAEKTGEIEKSKKQKGRWLIGGEFSPTYSYRHLTGGSTYEVNYYNQAESPLVSYSAGINIQYVLKKRLTIQSGIYYASMGQSIDHVSVYSNSVYDKIDEQYKSRYINNYTIRNSTGNVAVTTPFIMVDDKMARVENLNENKMAYDLDDPVFNDTKAEMQQKYTYLEIPVILRYKIMDKRVDLNLIGGVSLGYLMGNNVYLIYNSDKENVGSVENLNSFNYIGRLGFGIEYPLLNRVNFRLEPTFKYHINSLNENYSLNSHPYSFGINTGFSYSF